MKPIRERRAAGVLITAGTYLAALGVAIAAGAATAPGHPLLVVGVADLAAMTTVFIVSRLVDNSSIYDPYWSLHPLGAALGFLWLSEADVTTRQVLVCGLVALYAMRLTSNFYRDWPGLSKEDFRYRAIRWRTGRLYWPASFMAIHLLPTALVYLGCLPVYAVMRMEGSGLGWLDVAGAIVTLGAVGLAFAADEQLRGFRRDPANAGRTIQIGLWRLCRHPNYLGEILTWWGLYLFALGAARPWWWTGAGALAITVLFVFVSIPLMERRTLATRAGYVEYARRTPMLLPLPRRGRS